MTVGSTQHPRRANDRAGASSLLLAVPSAPQTRVAPADLELRSGALDLRAVDGDRPDGSRLLAHTLSLNTGGAIGTGGLKIGIPRGLGRRRNCIVAPTAACHYRMAMHRTTFAWINRRNRNRTLISRL